MKRRTWTARVLSLGAATLLLACGSNDGGANANAEAPAVDAGTTAPVAAATEIVRVQNALGSVEGTLEVPEAPGPVPLAIIVSGSGPQDRNGNSPADGKGPDMYRLLALGLRDAGIASVRFDDPGSGKSRDAFPRHNEQITYAMEVDIVVRWVDAMRADARFGPILIAGHSQGSLTAILVAQQRRVTVVSLAGAGRPIGRLLHDQLAPRLTPSQLQVLDDAIAKLERGELAGTLPAPIDSVLPPSVQPYMITWMKHDPSAELAKIAGPALVIQGATDTQVAVADAKLLSSAKPDAKLLVIADMCHPLKQAALTDQDQQKQYEDPSIPLHAKLVPAISDFARELPGQR